MQFITENFWTLAREQALEANLKAFRSVSSQVGVWLDSCLTFLEDRDFGLGVNIQALEGKRDEFQIKYDSWRIQRAVSRELGTLQKLLENGHHMDAETAQAC